jgi:hypothetical protein
MSYQLPIILWSAVEFILSRNYGFALAFFSYFLANIGLWYAAIIGTTK